MHLLPKDTKRQVLLLQGVGRSLRCVYTTHGTNSFTSHPKDEAMVKCLA